MRMLRNLSLLILGMAFSLLLWAPAESVAQEPALHFLSLPDELKEMNLARDIIFEDMNKDGRADILFIAKDKIYLSYQNTDASFSGFEVFISPLQGAVDFGDIFPGGEKEICVMHEQGISCFQKENGRWEMAPVLLAEKPTVYQGHALSGLTREFFIIDIDADGIPELILWSPKALHFYRKNKLDSYQLQQTLLLETSAYRGFLGLRVSLGPFAWLTGSDKRFLFHKEWPAPAHYFTWTEESVWPSFLIGDLNHDSKKDFAWIHSKQIINAKKGVYTAYEYRIHFFDEDRFFSPEPGRIIQDLHGAWLSPNCTDIDGDGNLDLLRYRMKDKGNLLQTPRIQFELFLAKESGEYPENPSQILETSDYPIGADLLTDVNGDGRKDLVLIHPERKGFSIGSIIRKYVEVGINAEVRVLPFRLGEGFSRLETFRKKVNVSFIAGVPISLAGDFNGDGLKDMLVVSGDRLRIYPFLGGNNKFSDLPWQDVKIPINGMPVVKDIEGDQRSVVVLFYPNRIGIFRINFPFGFGGRGCSLL